ncbi:UDP-glycosyltransferase UGT5 isoform X2 [Halyomorpha halys]|uniref:UDP-glycosyltransferase UGT5 isoform X2 n=1 Tax=Halyomorpha halys TaxID=286706 RepID=UPI0006D4E1B5|nr:UDP-glucuronosyltransferase 2B16-like isoform X2 [Halyomorpha halys]XP_014285749.1 UDP-glucuronosyltransferase 2B16-like isoform X2 [Halyomorpha halys]
MKINLVSLYIALIVKMVSPARILAIFPFSARSHFNMYEALLDELHARGHHLTVISHFPKKNATARYRDISLVGEVKSLNANMSLSDMNNFGLYDNLKLLNEQIDDYVPIFEVPEVNDLINSNESFDLILTEIFNSDVFLGFVHKFRCPYISISPCPLMPWAYHRIGLPIRPSVKPIVFSDRSYPMSLLDISRNTLDWIFALCYYKYVMNPKSEKIARKYFGDIPPLEELASRVSLILTNTHSSLHPSMTLSNRLIEVGGIHIKPAKPLESSLEQFLNDSEKGVIVFSMGSMFRAETLPKEIFDMFLRTFSNLKQNVLWKWESGTTPNITNIRFMKWLPQRDVLAHRNVKLFIYHGGLLGTSEAIYCGVPILGLPQFGDMGHNIASIGEAGMAMSLKDLTETSLTEAITTMIEDPKYKERALELSELYRDRPEDPLTRAAYWVEYVIRHKGTKHFVQSLPLLEELGQTRTKRKRAWET